MQSVRKVMVEFVLTNKAFREAQQWLYDNAERNVWYYKPLPARVRFFIDNDQELLIVQFKLTFSEYFV